MVYPSFHKICSIDFGSKSMAYCSDLFGAYKRLEHKNTDGIIMLGGTYSRGSDFYQLERFNYTAIVGNGRETIGWNFGIYAGDYGSVKGEITISFIINDLYLVKNKKNN